eukprot:CAMPEP_0115665560 /NCGR_PEP_ID=MMETSP0272-20121206/48951_1 /TAXON_ID=71861 /ORGANISM="Scrippsiella trochoidea, Strain CCMP3099" /LENGTH=69 /DNA_ID=CAMNT_0003104007 /DNA_START=63 /DNA_END=273 /DNA_ORIENTATION=-
MAKGAMSIVMALVLLAGVAAARASAKVGVGRARIALRMSTRDNIASPSAHAARMGADAVSAMSAPTVAK